MTEYEKTHFPSYVSKVHYDRWDIDELHPINLGRNVFGVASCMAFFKVIFHLSIHYKFGPILFCIKQVSSTISQINYWNRFYENCYSIRFAKHALHNSLGDMGRNYHNNTVLGNNVFVQHWISLHFWIVSWKCSQVLRIWANIQDIVLDHFWSRYFSMITVTIFITIVYQVTCKMSV